MIDLETIIGSNANLVDIYVLPPGIKASADENVVEVGWRRALSTAESAFGNSTVQNIKNYHHRDMTYTYDLGNDGQRAVRKLAQREMFAARARGTTPYYAIAFIEETVPPHRFPSTRDITFVEELKRSSYRVNNRLFFVHDEDQEGYHYYYFRYQHSENVDFRKIQGDLDRSMRKLK
jgi:hypothetical protein